MTQKPTVSVVIPVYNGAKTIAETVNSVLRQTFADWELIVIDDGSIDQTVKILERFIDSRIRIFSFKNAGPQKSRNRGIEQATGEYISFIDADDLWTPDKLEAQVAALKAAPEAGAAYSWTDVIDETSQVIQAGRRSRAVGDVFTALLQENFLGSGSNLLIRASALKVVGGFDETILAGQDWDLGLTLAANYPFVVVPKVQVLYRKVLSSRSWSSNLRRQEQGLMQVMKKHQRDRHCDVPTQSACLANCYRYLLFECFEKCAYTFQNGLLALRFFGRALLLEPSWWLHRYRLIFVVLLKSIRYLCGFQSPGQKAQLKDAG